MSIDRLRDSAHKHTSVQQKNDKRTVFLWLECQVAYQ